MYKLILFLLIIFSGCNRNIDDIYVNENYDIIELRDSNLIFYTRKCIIPKKILNIDDTIIMRSESFYCLNKNVSSYNIAIKLTKHSNSIVLESVDSCFMRFFNNTGVIFNKISDVAFNFNWDHLEIDYRENSNASSTYKTIKYKKRDLSYIQIIKLWLISNPDFEMQNKCSDCSYFVFKFYNGKSLVLEKELINLPCWYIEMK